MVFIFQISLIFNFIWELKKLEINIYKTVQKLFLLFTPKFSKLKIAKNGRNIIGIFQ